MLHLSQPCALTKIGYKLDILGTQENEEATWLYVLWVRLYQGMAQGAAAHLCSHGTIPTARCPSTKPGTESPSLQVAGADSGFAAAFVSFQILFHNCPINWTCQIPYSSAGPSLSTKKSMQQPNFSCRWVLLLLSFCKNSKAVLMLELDTEFKGHQFASVRVKPPVAVSPSAPSPSGKHLNHRIQTVL